jgi:outer membrane protein assembly factor BamD
MALTIVFWVSSCATKSPSGRTAAETLYQEALELVDSGRYLIAIENLNLIKSKYPYSYYATHAELLQADILFKQKNYVEAAAAYILFKDFHPKHPKIDYVILRIAESYYYQLPSNYDRDLTPGHEAIKYFKLLLKKFPQSKLVVGAKEKIKYCASLIEEKQLYIADFYFRTENFQSARYRYLHIIKSFTSKKITEPSMVKVIESSMLLGDFENCRMYYNQYKDIVSKDKKKGLDTIVKKCK